MTKPGTIIHEFEVYDAQDKFIGYEILTNKGWFWRCFELDPDKGERWCPGVYSNEKLKRVFK